MRLGVFPVMAGRQAGGPETYERRLVQAMADVAHDDEFHVFCLSKAAADSFGVARDNFRFHVLRPGLRVVSMTASLPLAVLRSRVELVHATFTPPPVSPRPYVFTIHCLTPITHPEFYDRAIQVRLSALIRLGIRNARHVICVSENTRDRTAELFGVPRERMTVVPNAVSEEFRVLPRDAVRERLASRYGLRDPYVLFIGKLEARKNILRILEAFAQLRAELGGGLKLVLVGRRTPTSHGLDETIARLGLGGDVIEPGYVEDADLPALYNGAELFCFPTLWEGFGIPLIEAMACGVPVVTSNLSALPEVAGDAALQVDPQRTEDIAAAMHRILREPELREQLRRRGLERARQFSWDRTARETLSAYRRAARA